MQWVLLLLWNLLSKHRYVSSRLLRLLQCLLASSSSLPFFSPTQIVIFLTLFGFAFCLGIMEIRVLENLVLWMMMLTHIGVTLSLLNPSVLFLECAVRSISQGS
jgi:hypothetical protein